MTDAEVREMARELVRGSIVEDAVSQFIAQVLKHAHDERIKPLRKQVADLEAKLAKAVEALDDLLEAITAEDRFGDRSLTITGSTANLKWLLDAEDTARATLAEIKGKSHD